MMKRKIKSNALLSAIALLALLIFTSCDNSKDVEKDDIKDTASNNVVDGNSEVEEDYEQIYSDLITSGEVYTKMMDYTKDIYGDEWGLKKNGDSLYSQDVKNSIPLDEIKANLFDIDKDGIPELLLEMSLYGFEVYKSTAIYKIKDGEAHLIHSDTPSFMLAWNSEFEYDKIDKKMYISRYNPNDFLWYDCNEEDNESEYGNFKFVYGYHKHQEAPYDNTFNVEKLEPFEMKPILELEFIKDRPKLEDLNSKIKLNQDSNAQYKYEDVDSLVFDLNEFTSTYGNPISEEKVENPMSGGYDKTLTYGWGIASFTEEVNKSYRLIGFDSTENLVGMPKDIKIGDSSESVINKFRNDGNYDDAVYFNQLGANEKLLYQSDYTNGAPSMGIIRYNDKNEVSNIEYLLDHQTGAINRFSMDIKDNKVYKITIFFGQT